MVPVEKSADEIVLDPSDALEFESVKLARPKRSGLKLFLLLVLTAGGVGAGWLYYGDQLIHHVGDQLPVVRAAEGPVKVRPKTPGGMAIPDRDKLVYGRMNRGTADPRVERLLPLPEIPKTPLSAKVKLNAVPAPSIVQSTAKKSIVPDKQNIEKSNVESLEAVLPSEIKAPVLKKNKDVVPKVVDAPLKAAKTNSAVPLQTLPVAAPSSSETPISGIAYQIQIAAVRTPDRARSEWARLKRKHGDLLGDYSLKVVRVDLGPTKGIFYRLRAGPIAWEDVAKALCKNLGKRKVGCLIVRPGG
jgi:hypothetical protein